MNKEELLFFLENTVADSLSQWVNIENLYNYMKEKNYAPPKNLEQPFWNHVASYLVRLRNNEQSEQELFETDEISPEAFAMVEELLNVLGVRNANATEKFLLAVYCQGMIYEKTTEV